MKKTYTIEMNNDGIQSHGGGWVKFTVQADSEFEAIQEAQKRKPNLKIASVKQQ